MKVDLKHTYCQIPVHPQDRHLLGVMWNEEVFVDRALSFGLRSAPKIISAVSDLIAWSFHRVSTRHHIHWFDDFILLLPSSSRGTALVLLVLVLATLDHLVFHVSRGEMVGPATCITFLGVLINTESSWWLERG